MDNNNRTVSTVYRAHYHINKLKKLLVLRNITIHHTICAHKGVSENLSVKTE